MAARNTGKTELFAQWQQGNLVVADEGFSTGARFWVDSATGVDDAGHGRSPSSPTATLDYAVGLCTASKGDVIYVMPGHAETVSAAGGLDLDVIGITVIGLGAGELRPTVTLGTADTADVDIDAANITIKNLLFKVGIDSLANVIDVNADDFTMENCEFREGSALQALSFVTLASANVADRCTIRRCCFIQTAAGGNQAILIDDAQDALLIEDCWIDGDWANAGIYSDAAFTDAMIRRNSVSNRNAGNHAIELTAAATGFLVDNRLYGDTLGTILDPGSLKCLGNLEVDAIDQAGVDTPRTSAGGLPDNSITAAAIATDAIDADAIAAGAIDAAAIATGAVDADAIAADTILGADNNNNAFASTNVVANADGSLIERLEYLQTPPQPRIVTKSQASCATGTLFTYAGNVRIDAIYAVITTAIQNQVTNCKLSVTPDALAAYDICANKDIGNFAIGSMLSITGTAASAMVGTTAVGSIAPGQADPVFTTCITSGTITVTYGAASTGALTWYVLYTPLSSTGAITAA